MAQEHRIFNHHEEEQKAADEELISETAFSNEYTGGNYTESVEVVLESTIDYEKEEEHHKHKEHLGEMGAVTAGACGLSEKDPEHAHRHKIEEEVAAVGVGAGGPAFQEAKEVEEAEGKKHHHLF